MIIAYIIFFALLNVIIFNFFTKKLKFSNKMLITLISICFLLLIFHFLGFFFKLISNNHLFHLMIFSLILFVINIFSNLLIIIIKKLNSNLEDHLGFKVFNFIRYYLVYILIFVYQCSSLLLISSREHFKSIESIF